MTEDEREANFARDLSEDELDALMFRARRPGIMLNKTKYADDPGAPGCWLGGDPTLPPDIDWPISSPGTDFETPMHFLAQIDLANLPRVAAHPEMPRSGTLFFFADMVYGPKQGFGFGASEEVRRRHHTVIYILEDVSTLPPRTPPQMPPPTSDQFYWYREAPRHSFKKWNFDFLFFEGLQRPRHIHPSFDRRLTDALIAISTNRWKPNRNHREDQELWKQTEDRRTGSGEGASQFFRPHHVFGSIGGREPEHLVRLFAIGSDEDLAFNNDGHWVVFWIANSELAAGHFADTHCCTEFA